jgi:hypothetical protein
MKRMLTLIVFALTIVTANAQNPKLNFEAPLFGVTAKNVKPAWSVVAFGNVEAGASFACQTPDAMRPVGCYAELTLVELQARPWRNENYFTCGITVSSDRHFLQVNKYAFGLDGSIVPLPALALTATWSSFIENAVSLQLGYVREFGNWKTGISLLPGIGWTTQRNSYVGGAAYYNEYEDVLQFRHDTRGRNTLIQDNASGNLGFRLELKAGIWYKNIGLTASYSPAGIGPHGFCNRYDSFKVGISFRY